MFVRQFSHEMKNSKTKWVLGHKMSLHPTSGDFDLVVCETPPNTQGPPPHIHSKYEEAFYILEGEMEFLIHGELQTYKAGESIDVPSGTLHTFNNKAEKRCVWINIHSPKGFWSFFDTFGILETTPDAQNRSLAPECIQSVLKRAGEFDVNIRLE